MSVSYGSPRVAREPASVSPDNRKLLSAAKGSDGVLKCLHVGEPQGRRRGIEASKFRRQCRDTCAVTVLSAHYPGKLQRRLYKHAKPNGLVPDWNRRADHCVRRRVDD